MIRITLGIALVALISTIAALLPLHGMAENAAIVVALTSCLALVALSAALWGHRLVS